MIFSRHAHLQGLLDKPQVDVCVVGGGASGAGIALDAALRGHRVLLIEQGDFCAQTSSKSTKLVHGGVRYLEQAVKTLDWQQLRMVYKALHERKNMLRNAPHLAHPLALITPCYSWFDRMYYRLGMYLYDRLAGSSNLKDSQALLPKQLVKRLPNLEAQGSSGGILYYDGQFNDARYGLAILQSAAQEGAIVLNYAKLTSLSFDAQGKIQGLVLEDVLSGSQYPIACKALINATGPFADHLRQMANPSLAPRIQVSRGAHIVLPSEFWPGSEALLIPKTHDGRVVFVIPWMGHTLVGTTDEPDALTLDPEVLVEEKTYLLDYFNQYAKRKAQAADISGVFVGQRPLILSLGRDGQPDTKAMVRDHEVEVDQGSGLISILGGKWTTYRLMAQDTVDAMERSLFQISPRTCLTARYALYGSPKEEENLPELLRSEGLSEELINSWLQQYGSASKDVLACCKAKANGLQAIVAGAPYCWGELDYLQKSEMAVCLEDVLERRWNLGKRNAALAQALKKEITKAGYLWVG